MQLTLVHNPRSGRGADADALADALTGAGASGLTLRAIEAVGDGPPPPGTERVVVAGGDGSIAPVAVWAASAGLPFAVIPVGTANDFARAFGLPTELPAAAALATDPHARIRALELGRISGRPFVNTAAAGLATDAARRAAAWKRRLGPLAYAVGAIGAGTRADPIDVTIRADAAQRFSGPVWQVIVAATGAFGGGAQIGPARPDDGVLDVTVIPAGYRGGLVRRGLGLRRGTLHAQSGVVRMLSHDLEIDLPDGEAWNVDGELWRPPSTPSGTTVLTVEHHAIDAVVPG